MTYYVSVYFNLSWYSTKQTASALKKVWNYVVLKKLIFSFKNRR